MAQKKPALKPRPCKWEGCTRGEDGGRNNFIPHNRWHVCCHYTCAIEYQKEVKAKRKKKEAKLNLKEFNQKDRAYMLKQTQEIFNRYIRLRDKDKPCVSCGHTGNRQRHASHFRPVGRNAIHRFSEDNVHASCSICNSHLSGNLVPYREELLIRIGPERLEALESNNDPKIWQVEELRELQDHYKAKIRELECV